MNEDILISPIEVTVPIPRRLRARGLRPVGLVSGALQELKEAPAGSSRFFAGAKYYGIRSAIRRVGEGAYRWAYFEEVIEHGTRGVRVWTR